MINPESKKTIENNGLIILLCVLIGIIAMPALLIQLFNWLFWIFSLVLMLGPDKPTTWLVVLALYIIIRIIIGAIIKAVKKSRS